MADLAKLSNLRIFKILLDIEREVLVILASLNKRFTARRCFREIYRMALLLVSDGVRVSRSLVKGGSALFLYPGPKRSGEAKSNHKDLQQ
jgi:hypothetical protein